jgi:ribosome biogenesis GTPase A
MTRARRQIQEKLKWIDLAIELLDARIPRSSRNPMIDEILHNKPRLILLNKADLADPRATERWVAHFADSGIEALPVDASSGTNVQRIPQLAQKILQARNERRSAKGMKPGVIRTLIVGIPNVGKSTLINRLAGRSAAAVGDRPGVTKGQQWIKVGTEMELLDTPGILWPKFEDEEVGYKLAMTGAIREEILQLEEIGFHAVRYLAEMHPRQLADRFELQPEEMPDDLQDPEQIAAVLEQIGRKRGCLISGGRIDLEKSAGVLLRDLRTGKLGRITLELPQSRPTVS